MSDDASLAGLHLFLVVPGWKLSPLHAQSREHLMMLCMQRGVSLTICPEFASGIDLARNITVAKFLQQDNVGPRDVLAMIDSDLAFNPESVFAILESMRQGLEVVGAIYPKKIVNYEKAADATRHGVPASELKYHAAEFVGGAFPGSKRSHKSQDGKHRFVQADLLGTGFLFMRRDAVEKFVAHHRERIEHHSPWEPKGLQHLVFFSEPMGKRQEARDALLSTARRFHRHHADVNEMHAAVGRYNAAMDAPERDVYSTEDFSFTRRAKEAGIGCWLYLDAEVAHQGTWVFEGSMARVHDHLVKRKEEAAQ